MQADGGYTPSYTKIQNYVLEQIHSGLYPPGCQIPSEVELARLFSVSRITANKAIKELAVMGVLERVRGRGTFVCSPRTVPTQALAFVSAAKLDITGSRSHQLLQFRLLPDPPPPLAEKFGLDSPQPFYEIILANQHQQAIESLDFLYLPCALIPDISSSLHRLSNRFVADFLKSQPGLAPKFLKIFVNIPLYSFLEQGRQYLSWEGEPQIWSTDIYDGEMGLLCTTYTLCPNTAQDIPLFTFSL